MQQDLFAWADLAMDIVQGVALAAILWQLFYLRAVRDNLTHLLWCPRFRSGDHTKEDHRRAAEKGHKA